MTRADRLLLSCNPDTQISPAPALVLSHDGTRITHSTMAFET